jgi:Uma2 family endonuclease
LCKKTRSGYKVLVNDATRWVATLGWLELLSRIAPDVCVEVLSPSNSAREIQDKTAAYFAVGVREVWICDRDGKMSFHSPEGPRQRSAICPDFPREIPSKVLP